MIVLKIGGTSVMNTKFMQKITERMQHSDKIFIVVLSALSQVTNTLEAIYNETNINKKMTLTNKFIDIHNNFISELFGSDTDNIEKAKGIVEETLQQIDIIIKGKQYDLLMALGEYLSTSIYSLFLQSKGLDYILNNSLDFIKLDENRKPNTKRIKFKCKQTKWKKINLFQGFICLDKDNNITNLSRGGSDFTATLLGEAVKAEVIEIWSDMDGFRSNDPRYVKNTNCVPQLHYLEAAELAYFGAKILHPESVLPAQRVNIPMLLKNSKNITHAGTLINNKQNNINLKAIAAKDKIILINITSYRMLMIHGFLSKIFDVFNIYKTSVDLITTSEISVSLTIDDTTYLKDIIKDLKTFSQVEVKYKMAIISIVGNLTANRKQIAAEILNTISNPIEMISYGSNRTSISILVDQENKNKNLNELNELTYK